MKKMSLIMIVVWSGIGLMVIAALMLSIVFKEKGGFGFMPGFDRSGRSNMQLVTEETIPMRGIDKIELEFSSDECIVYITSSDNIGVKHYARRIAESRYARVEGYGSTVAVSTKPPGFLEGFSLFGFENRSVVEIYLPEEYKNALSAELMSGSLRFDGDLDLSEFSARVSSGTIRSEYSVKARNTEIIVTSGSIRITNGVMAENYALKISSGTLTVDGGLKGSGSVNVTSGKVKLSGVDITDSLDVKVSSGTLDIGMAGDASFNFNGRKSSGTIRTYFDLPNNEKNVSASVGEAPYKNLNVAVTSGTVRITE